MKTPQEIANTFIAAMPADRAETLRKWLPRIVAAANGEPIYGGEFNDTKRPIDYTFEKAFDELRERHRPDVKGSYGATGYYGANDEKTPWALINDALGYAGNLRNSISMAKKIAKLKISDPYVTAMKQFLAACVPMAELIESVKKKVIKGRRPPAQTAVEKRIAGRAGGSGTCQICAGDQAIVRSKIALHGYERPGHGYIHGRCYGAGELPFEVSCDALKHWIGKLRGYVTSTHDELARLPFIEKLLIEERVRDSFGHQVYEGGKAKTKMVLITPLDPRFEPARKTKQHQLESQLRQLDADIKHQTKRLESWKPAA